MGRCIATLCALWIAACHAAPAATTPAADPEACDALVDGGNNPLWQSYLDAPDIHPNLPNVSYAGYRYGETLPNLSHAVRINVADHGAQPNTDVDSSDAIEAALNAVPAEGGVVYFPAGSYRLSRPLIVQRSHVVLQGAGSDQTRLIFTRSLNDGYAQNVDPLGKSRWSWTGGMVWLTPRNERTRVNESDLSTTWTEGWSLLDSRANITSDHERGDLSFTVDDASDLHPAQLVVLEVDSSVTLLKHLAGDGAFADTQDWSVEGASAVLPPTLPTVHWPVSITSVEGNVITLKQPLRFDLRAEWSPRIRPVAQVITESGVRDLSIVLSRETTYDPATAHHHEVGWNGIALENALHCFVENVKVIDAESAFLVTASKNLTLRAFSIEATDAARLLQHHGTTTRVFSNDLLFEDFTITTQPIHGISVEGFSMGNVWSRGMLEHGTWDLHRALPMENVLTELVINNDGDAGGRSTAGPHAGARHAVWNVRVTNNDCSNLGDASNLPSGAIVGLRGCEPIPPGNSDALVINSGTAGTAPSPNNLYEAERAARLCAEQ